MKPRERKYYASITFLITGDMYKELDEFAKKRRLSLSKVARDVMEEGMKVLSKDIGRKINGKQD